MTQHRPFGTQSPFLLTIVLGALALASCQGKPLKKEWEFISTGPSYSTPLVLDKVVVFGNESGDVTAVDKETGQRVWRYAAFKNVISHPAFGHGKIWFGSINTIFFGLNPDSSEFFKFQTKAPIKGDPLVTDDMVYIGSYDQHLYAFLVKGQPKPVFKWQFPAELSRKTIIKEIGPDGQPRTREVFDTIPEVLEVGAFAYSAPVLSKGILYVGNLYHNLYAIKADNGQMVYRFKTGAQVTSSPLVHEGVVYFGSNDRHLYAIKEGADPNQDKSAVLWKYETKGWINSSPRESDGKLYVGSLDKNLYVLDYKNLENGRPREVCTFQAAGEIISYPAFYKNLVIFAGGQNDGHIYAVDKNTCKLLQKEKTGWKIESDPVVDGDRLYVTSGDKKLYAFRLQAD